MRGSRNFHQRGGGGGGEGPGQSDKKALTTVFLFSAYFTEVKWSISKKSIVFKAPDGSNFLQGVQLFPGCVQLLIPYRNPFNL